VKGKLTNTELEAHFGVRLIRIRQYRKMASLPERCFCSCLLFWKYIFKICLIHISTLTFINGRW